jgi:hypothetical protein
VKTREQLEAVPAAAVDAWPLSWSGVWVGALAAIAVTLTAGLVGLALGAHQVGQGDAPTLREAGFWSLALTVAGAFFSFVVGGWVAGKLCSDRRSEVTSLHGAIAWLVAVPLFLLLIGTGAGPYFGNWLGSLAWIADAGGVDSLPAAEFARALRNAALGGLTALLLGLAGAVLGGWMASGEPMSARYRRAEAA